MDFTIFFWGKSKFFFEGSKETGVVTESISMKDFSDIQITEQSILAHVESFFGDELMNRYTVFFLK